VADVDNFRVRMLAAQAELAGAKGLHETGRVILAELMGIDGAQLPADLELSPLVEESEEELAMPVVANFMAEASVGRPDLRQMEELVRVEEENVRAVYGQYQPVVLMTGSWGFNRTSNLRYEVDDQSSAAGIEVRWEIFNGGAREARIRAAESSLAELCAGLTRQRLSVESEVRRAVIDVQDSQQQILLQRENLNTARENRRLVQAGYLGGKETLNRLNEAQRDYITSDANLALARIRLRQAWSDLRAASGATLDPPVSPSAP
jgi:outer membrane protein TolC